MKKIYLIITINLLLLVLQYGLTNHFSTFGVAVSQAESQIDDLTRKNSLLTNHINELSSLTKISNQAAMQNLVPMRVEFITIPGLASRPN